jgi:hypothetical protein
MVDSRGAVASWKKEWGGQTLQKHGIDDKCKSRRWHEK